MNILRMADLDLAGKRVLIREDLNVPVKDGRCDHAMDALRYLALGRWWYDSPMDGRLQPVSTDPTPTAWGAVERWSA